MLDGAADIFISIHAPAKGATTIFHELSHRPTNFNPRSREGSDSLPATYFARSLHFNPRSREGSDGLLHLLYHQQ